MGRGPLCPPDLCRPALHVRVRALTCACARPLRLCAAPRLTLPSARPPSARSALQVCGEKWNVGGGVCAITGQSAAALDAMKLEWKRECLPAWARACMGALPVGVPAEAGCARATLPPPLLRVALLPRLTSPSLPLPLCVALVQARRRPPTLSATPSR